MLTEILFRLLASLFPVMILIDRLDKETGAILTILCLGFAGMLNAIRRLETQKAPTS